MNVSRCRFWFCTTCNGVVEKQGLRERIEAFSGTGDVTIVGTIECGNCHSIYQLQDIYTGNHDLPRQHWSQIEARDGRPMGL